MAARLSITFAPTHQMNNEFVEGFFNGVSEMYKRVSHFKHGALKVNLVIEALGVFHRSCNDRLEFHSPNSTMRKIGYLQGIYFATNAFLPLLGGSHLSPRVMQYLGLHYTECLLTVINNAQV